MDVDTTTGRERGMGAREKRRAGRKVPVVQDVREEQCVVAARPLLPEHVDCTCVDSPVSPASATYSFATSHIAGNSMIVHCNSAWRCASAMQKQPEPPPTSSSLRTPEKSTLRAMPSAGEMEWLCMKLAIIRACSISTCPAAQPSLGRSPAPPVVDETSPFSAFMTAP